MPRALPGLHHITAISGDPQKNVDFYAGLLGLRLVKQTVNFDDPGTYHLYFGNERGEPGTLMTFFPWGDSSPRGRPGTGQVTRSAFSVPAASIDYWRDRLNKHDIHFNEDPLRFGERLLSFADPDGLGIELVFAEKGDTRKPWPHFLPEQHAIRGIHHVTLSEEGYERTADLLTRTMGLRRVGKEGERHRFAAGEGLPGGVVDVVCNPEATRGDVARGTVHHIAFRTPDAEDQSRWRLELAIAGYNVTPIIDRTYFSSVYFREPGGVLFEIATDPPGFTLDEPEPELGTHLMLPRQYESVRKQLEAHLQPLRLPAGGEA